jgi:transposase
MAYSTEVRQLVLDACQRGEATEDILRFFGISQATLSRWKKQFLDHGQVAPNASCGRTPKLLGSSLDLLKERLKAYPDATLEELADFMTEQGHPVSHMSVFRALEREGISRKKNAQA